MAGGDRSWRRSGHLAEDIVEQVAMSAAPDTCRGAAPRSLRPRKTGCTAWGAACWGRGGRCCPDGKFPQARLLGQSRRSGRQGARDDKAPHSARRKFRQSHAQTSKPHISVHSSRLPAPLQGGFAGGWENSAAARQYPIRTEKLLGKGSGQSPLRLSPGDLGGGGRLAGALPLGGRLWLSTGPVPKPVQPGPLSARGIAAWRRCGRFAGFAGRSVSTG